MVKCLITYESPNKEWIESFEHIKSIEGLAYIIKRKEDNGEITTEINEVCTSNEDIIKLRDFLNNLKLSEGN